ncbi:hypothetical protein GLAREA_04128 [Glarea lozoyensis ATCC 20868]|uniref:Heterokaryon incompatibility domain-containing protein n=1 Tax=Glarea lozoyensis (strain ATCC 20868 / MF5171) TaxID=1116229 RepID=S3DGK0_GLAL2|nr:uncharacterized protein GLAREA_04128 [Glarea lozoyensis ATCC 20868]EPE31161.1 hypothetical protein GLAREA_04128 [Glarea lozoyensis ATCC 20868]
MLCAFCTGISLSGLIELAEVEFASRQSPQHAYYKHYDSYNDLVQSATDGCDLCQMILAGFTSFIVDLWPWDGQTRDEAVRETEYLGKAIDVRISIDADHLYFGQSLDQVALFDLLVVQVGAAAIKYEEKEWKVGSHGSEGSEGKEEDVTIPPLLITLSVPRDKQIRIGKYRVGRYRLDPVLTSQNNFSIAKSWIEDCCNNHQSCPVKHSPELPARVIDVGNLGDEQILRLVHSHSSTGQYAALSHCWGGLISTRLLADTLKSFQTDISFSSLPENFRDAVTITRHLGIKYLWIDALCIIQDSASDWEIESKKMGDVYQNALITISAAMSPGSTAGILTESSREEAVKEHVMGDMVSSDSSKVSYDGNSGIEVYLSLNDKEEETLRNLFLSSPLSKRGWCLQESILSPRILHYGSKQIYWQCPHGFQSADGVPAGNLMPDNANLYSAISNVLHQHLQRDVVCKSQHDRRPILTDYYNLVEEYSSRQLTYNSDKFPAFSGIARLLHPVIGASYLAGMWSNDFAQGLCWHHEIFQCRHTLSEEAPSWSWAVTTDPILFAHIERKDAPGPYDSTITQHDVKVRGGNPYGQVQSGSIVIEGLVKTFRRSKQVISSGKGSIARIFMDEFENPDNELEGVLDLFEVDEVDGQSYLLSALQRKSSSKVTWFIDFDLISPVSYIALIVITSDEESFYDGEFGTSAQALVLRKVNKVRKTAGLTKVENGENNGKEIEEEECLLYERVGYFDTMHWKQPSFKRWMETWDRKSVTII